MRRMTVGLCELFVRIGGWMKGARPVRREVNEFLMSSYSNGRGSSEVVEAFGWFFRANRVTINILWAVISGVACGFVIT